MKFTIALLFSFLLSGTQAEAQYTRYVMRLVCKFDWEQYCKAIPAKRIRDLRECLAVHEKDLLPQCRDHYKDAK